MELKKKPCVNGLGDRLGNYLIYSMLGYLYDKNIVTYWEYDNKWGTEYPSNIFDYINFPENLIFISKEEFQTLNCDPLQYRWVYHGFDYIPETIYRSLFEDEQINCSYDEMLVYYRRACSEIFYKKDLPDIIKTRPGIIHIRRGDKGQNTNHDKKIDSILNDNALLNLCDHFIVVTDDIQENSKYHNNKIMTVKFSKYRKIRTLEEFFVCSHCKVIVQSVPGNNKYGGWSGFSYIPFQLGLALYPRNMPLLISLSEEYKNTRLTAAKTYANRPLLNIYHFPIKYKDLDHATCMNSKM